jgi:hypothetical protein
VTLLACVSAAGNVLTPMVISELSVRDSLWTKGLREDENAMVRQRNPAYVTEELFFQYMINIFIPYVANIRQRPEFANDPVVLFMDSALPHISERVLRLLRENKIMTVVFPTHTTNIFQAMDLVFFDALKKLKETAIEEFDDDSMNDQITELIQAYEQIATSITIRRSFKRADMYPNMVFRPFKLRIDEEMLKNILRFKEIWDRNIMIEKLSRHWRLYRFGLINGDFLIE